MSSPVARDAAPPIAVVIVPTTPDPRSSLSDPPLVINLMENPDKRLNRSIMGISKGRLAGQSTAYNEFVDHSSGLIQRIFCVEPFPTFRLDLSGDVSTGLSWQLPVLIAHALYADGRRLGFEAASADMLVWATGRVDPLDYSIGEVGHISEKLRRSRPMLEQAKARGQRIAIFLPEADRGRVEPDVEECLVDLGLTPLHVSSIDQVLDALGLPPVPNSAAAPKSLQWSGNPYRGLEPFRREHRRIFFGRARAREEALEQLDTAAQRSRRAFLLVHGSSGAGKSSFAQAALSFDVEDRFAGEGWLGTAVVTPTEGGSPIAALHDGLAKIVDPTFRPNVPRSPPDADDVRGQLNEIRRKGRGAGVTPSGLLIVDQLEEALSETHPLLMREEFGALVDEIARSRCIYVIATMRSDAMGRLDRAGQLAKLASAERLYRLDRPSVSELVEIIVSPARLAGRAFPDRRIPEELAELAQASPDSLPLLQALLYHMFETSGRTGRMTETELRRLGGFAGSLGNWAEEVEERVLAADVDAATLDRILAALVGIDPESRRALARTIAYQRDTPEGAILSKLVDSRLVSTSSSMEGPRARLAHEVLLTHWPRLARVVEQLSAALLIRDDLEKRALAWIDRREDAAELLRGAGRIEAAEAFVAEALVAFAPEVKPYVVSSRAAAEDEITRNQRLIEAELEGERLKAAAVVTQLRQQRRWTNAAMVVGLAFLIVAIGVGYLWYMADMQRFAMLRAQGLRLVEIARQELEQQDPAASLDIALSGLVEEGPHFGNAPPYLPEAFDLAVQAIYEIREVAFREDYANEAVVTDLAFSTDGQTLVYAMDSGEIRFWKIGDEETSLTLPCGLVTDLAYASEVGRVAVICDGKTIILHDLASGHHKIVLQGEKFDRLGFSSTGRRVFAVDSQRKVMLHEIDSGTSRSFDCPDALAVAVDDIDDYLYSVDSDAISSFKLSKVEDEPLQSAKLPSYALNAAFTADARQVFVQHDEGKTATYFPFAAINTESYELPKPSAATLAPWMIEIAVSNDGATAAVLRGDTMHVFRDSVSQGHLSFQAPVIGLSRLAISADGNRLALTNVFGVSVWTVDNLAANRLRSQNLNRRSKARAVAFSPDGSTLYSGFSDGTIGRWAAWERQQLAPIQIGSVDEPTSLVVLKRQNLIVAGFGDTGTVRLFDSASGSPIGPTLQHGQQVASPVVSRDERYLAAPFSNGTVIVLDLSDFSQKPLDHRDQPVRSAAFSADGTRLFTGTTSGRIWVWDVGSGKPIISDIPGQDSQIQTISFSPDGKKLVTGGLDGTLVFRSPETGAVFGDIHFQSDPDVRAVLGAEIYAAAFSPDGKRFAVGADIGLRLWDVSGLTPVPLVEETMVNVNDIVFSPDGELLASGAGDSTVKFWSAADGSPKGMIQAHTSIVEDIAFSPDGKLLATASSDGTTALWPIFPDPPALKAGAARLLKRCVDPSQRAALGMAEVLPEWCAGSAESKRQAR